MLKNEADNVIKDFITRWPSVHPTRGAVLNYLFYTAGNGYMWKDGSIVRSVEDSRTQQSMLDRRFRELEQSNNPDLFQFRMLQQEQKEIDNIMASLSDRVQRTDIPSGHYSPETESSLIRQMPNFPAPVWKHLSEEAADLHQQYQASNHMKNLHEIQR